MSFFLLSVIHSLVLHAFVSADNVSTNDLTVNSFVISFESKQLLYDMSGNLLILILTKTNKYYLTKAAFILTVSILISCLFIPLKPRKILVLDSYLCVMIMIMLMTNASLK